MTYSFIPWIDLNFHCVVPQLIMIAVSCNLLKAREKSRLQVATGFGFVCHWLKNWREPITKRSNRNRAITFDSPLKTDLSE